MHAADGTFFTSAFAIVVAHLLVKYHLKPVIGCSWKMKTACLAGPEVETFQHVRMCACKQ